MWLYDYCIIILTRCRVVLDCTYRQPKSWRRACAASLIHIVSSLLRDTIIKAHTYLTIAHKQTTNTSQSEPHTTTTPTHRAETSSHELGLVLPDGAQHVPHPLLSLGCVGRADEPAGAL